MLVVLSLPVLAACSGAGQGREPGGAFPSPGTTEATGGNKSTETPAQITPVPDLPVKVLSQTPVTDADGNVHLVGRVHNGSDTAVEGVTLAVAAVDSAGTSLLRAESGEVLPQEEFSPLVGRAAPNADMPFDFPLPPGAGLPAQSKVFVISYQPSQSGIIPLQVINMQWMTSAEGRAVLVGELVNTASFPVRVDSLAALANKADGIALSAAQGTLFPGILMPQGDQNQQDRAPFLIPFDLLPGEQMLPEVFTAVSQVNPLDGAPLAIDQDIEAYMDSVGTFHLVSSIKNPTDQPLGVLILGGLYAASGSVMDASGLLLPVDLQPGEELPFDLNQFKLINQKPDYQAKLDHFTLQVDPSRLTALKQVRVPVDAQNPQVQAGDAGKWTFTGEVTNSSSQDLQQIVVIAVVKKPTGTVSATAFAQLINPGGMLTPSMKMSYSIEVMADPALDASTLKTQLIVIGISG